MLRFILEYYHRSLQCRSSSGTSFNKVPRGRPVKIAPTIEPKVVSYIDSCFSNHVQDSHKKSDRATEVLLDVRTSNVQQSRSVSDIDVANHIRELLRIKQYKNGSITPILRYIKRLPFVNNSDCKWLTPDSALVILKAISYSKMYWSVNINLLQLQSWLCRVTKPGDSVEQDKISKLANMPVYDPDTKNTHLSFDYRVLPELILHCLSLNERYGKSESADEPLVDAPNEEEVAPDEAVSSGEVVSIKNWAISYIVPRAYQEILIEQKYLNSLELAILLKVAAKHQIFHLCNLFKNTKLPVCVGIDILDKLLCKVVDSMENGLVLVDQQLYFATSLVKFKLEQLNQLPVLLEYAISKRK